MEPLFTGLFLRTQPAFQLFGCMRGAMVQDEGHRVYLAAKGFGNDDLLQKSLEIDQALALSASAVELSIGDGESGKQVAGAAPMRACLVQHRLVRACWARRLLTLTRLDGGFLIEAKQPGACSQERLRLGIGLEDRASPLQEGLGVMNVLPGVIAPGAKPFRFEPAAHAAGREVRQRRILADASRQLGSAPARQRNLALLGQATGDGRDLRTHLRGKNASAPHCAARQQVNGSLPSAHATSARCDR